MLLRELLPDRSRRAKERLVVLLPFRRRRVNEEPVWPGRPEDAREPMIADREVVREPVVERDLAAVVVAHDFTLRRASVRAHEAVVGAAVVLGVLTVPVVRRIL